MSDASCRLLTTLFDIADEAEIEHEAIMEGSGVTLDYAMTPSNWLTWSELTYLTARSATLLGGYGFLRARAAEVIFATSTNRTLTAVTRAFTSPKMVYRAMARWVSKQLFAVNHWEFIEEGGRDCLMKITFDEGYEITDGFLHLVAATLEGIPSVVGYEHAQVDWTIHDRVVEYAIRVPRSKSLVARVMRLIRAPFAAWPVMAELESQAKQLEYRLTELAAAQQEIEAASTLKSTFLSTISLELRNQLNGVIGSMDLLADASMPADQRELVRANRSSGERLGALIGKMLDFTHVADEEYVPSQGIFDPTELVDSLAHRMRDEGGRAQIRVSTPASEVVIGDSLRISQILGSFVENARTHGEATQIDLHVTRSEDCWLFAVVDNGVGMTPAEMRRVFEPLSQGDCGLGRRDNTIGLSIAIGQRLATAMGGEIRCESSSQGTRFELELPLETYRRVRGLTWVQNHGSRGAIEYLADGQ